MDGGNACQGQGQCVKPGQLRGGVPHGVEKEDSQNRRYLADRAGLADQRGRKLFDSPQKKDDQGTGHEKDIASDNRERQPEREQVGSCSAGQAESDERGRQKNLVRGRVEPDSRFAPEIKASGGPPVQNVGDPGRKKNDEGRPGPSGQNFQNEKRDEDDPQETDQVGQEPRDFQRINLLMISRDRTASGPETGRSGRNCLSGERSMIW